MDSLPTPSQELKIRAQNLKSSGAKVGIVYLTGVPLWYCHMCKKTNPTYKFTSDIEYLSSCCHCHTPYILMKNHK